MCAILIEGNFMKLLISLITLSLLTQLSATQIPLKTGWNLIGINSTDPVTILNSNPNIVKAAGGGVGGGGDFGYNRAYSQYAKGSMKLGQGYWILTDSDTTLAYTPSTQTNSSIELLEGWNLINSCVEIDAANIATDYPNVTKAAGGGVGGGGDFNYNKDYAQYAKGVTKVGQGYWFKVDNPFNITCILPFDYRAWGMGGDADNSKLTVMVNGIYYTLVAYSKLDIQQSNASTAGDVTSFTGKLNSKTIIDIFTISNDYNSHKVVINLYNNDSNFTKDSLLINSEPIVANNSYQTYDLIVENADDYRPIEPTDANIEMPPVAPVF